MKPLKHPKTDPAAAWLPTALAMGLTGIAVGTTIVAMNGKDFISPSVGSVLGGLVGATVAILLWG